jgi:hypothetical protein
MPCLIRRISRRASHTMIDADSFIRYQHFGEGAYEENEQEIQEFLVEKDESLN